MDEGYDPIGEYLTMKAANTMATAQVKVFKKQQEQVKAVMGNILEGIEVPRSDAHSTGHKLNIVA